ncbi:MAG: Aldehyde dehydrogenase, partial [uncultured Rubellimicrobium sp.]
DRGQIRGQPQADLGGDSGAGLDRRRRPRLHRGSDRGENSVDSLRRGL